MHVFSCQISKNKTKQKPAPRSMSLSVLFMHITNELCLQYSFSSESRSSFQGLWGHLYISRATRTWDGTTPRGEEQMPCITEPQSGVQWSIEMLLTNTHPNCSPVTVTSHKRGLPKNDLADSEDGDLGAIREAGRWNLCKKIASSKPYPPPHFSCVAR